MLPDWLAAWAISQSLPVSDRERQEGERSLRCFALPMGTGLGMGGWGWGVPGGRRARGWECQGEVGGGCERVESSSPRGPKGWRD